MARAIKIKKPTRRSTDLDGIHATFSIEDCHFRIHYFSTYASPKTDADQEHYRQLLEELKPMRERVAASEIRDLNALLQRDLSDSRIALELVPYLRGKHSKVGFFPPVLAVLVPTGFISAKNQGMVRYPKRSETKDGIAFDHLWSLSYHGEGTRLGRLSINDGTEIIVLDGQHRSNAFRYVCGVMEPDALHEIFYEAASRPKSFEGDLPVTIAWFEAINPRTEVQPNDISRELFVAVNNNAKPVSASRTILLNEGDPECLAVNSYFSELAQRKGFSPGGMNLLCACFDIDVDESLAGARPIFALTNPIILRWAVRYAFFALDIYDDLERDKANKKAQTNKNRLDRLLGRPVGYVDTRGGRRIQPILHQKDRKEFRQLVSKQFVPLLDALFDKSEIAKVHHTAVVETAKWVRDSATATIQDVWDKVFCGGEGLFAQIRTAEKSAKVKVYQRAISEIESAFKQGRRSIARKTLSKKDSFSDEQIDRAYELFDTIAFQTGVLMALSVYAKALHKKGKTPLQCQKMCCQVIERISLVEWIRFFNVFADLYLKNLETNSWPRFQKLFIRLFCQEIDIFKKFPDRSPDKSMVTERARALLKATVESGKPPKEIKAADVNRFVDDALKRVEDAFKVVGEKIMHKDSVKKAARDLVQRELQEMRGKKEGRSVAAKLEESDDDSSTDTSDLFEQI